MMKIPMERGVTRVVGWLTRERFESWREVARIDLRQIDPRQPDEETTEAMIDAVIDVVGAIRPDHVTPIVGSDISCARLADAWRARAREAVTWKSVFRPERRDDASDEVDETA